MATVHRLIDRVLTQFGTGYCPHCHRFGWCQIVWNAEQERYDPTCLDCFLGQLGITREHYNAILETAEDDEAPEDAEEPMTKSQLIGSLIGLLLTDALFTFGLRYWADHDPRIGDPFMHWVIIPLISIFAVGMATLQLYWYKHPNQADEGDEEGNP